jgi:hypothetical protein
VEPQAVYRRRLRLNVRSSETEIVISAGPLTRLISRMSFLLWEAHAPVVSVHEETVTNWPPTNCYVQFRAQMLHTRGIASFHRYMRKAIYIISHSDH